VNSTAPIHSCGLGYAEGTLLKSNGQECTFWVIHKRTWFYNAYKKHYEKYHCTNPEHTRVHAKPAEHKEWTTLKGSHPTPNPFVESRKWRYQDNSEASTCYLSFSRVC